MTAMTSWMRRSMALLTLVLGLAACETYQTVYTPPPTEAGRQCLTQCDAMRQNCQMSNNMLKQSCEMAHNDRMRQYQSCEIMYGRPQPICRAYDNNGRCTHTEYPQSPCVKPINTCTSNDSQCSTNYNACYQNCGGRVDRVKVE